MAPMLFYRVLGATSVIGSSASPRLGHHAIPIKAYGVGSFYVCDGVDDAATVVGAVGTPHPGHHDVSPEAGAAAGHGLRDDVIGTTIGTRDTEGPHIKHHGITLNASSAADPGLNDDTICDGIVVELMALLTQARMSCDYHTGPRRTPS